MILSEEKISGILDDHLSVANSTGHAWVSVKSIDAAARAIAKKLAEGVVWQRGALVDNDANFILKDSRLAHSPPPLSRLR